MSQLLSESVILHGNGLLSGLEGAPNPADKVFIAMHTVVSQEGVQRDVRIRRQGCTTLCARQLLIHG